MSTVEPVLAIGMMSGTSVDGAIDTAAVVTDGDAYIERRLVKEYRYEKAEGLRPIHHLTKAAEIAFRLARGDMNLATQNYERALRKYAADTFPALNEIAIKAKIAELNDGFWGDSRKTPALRDIIAISSELHRAAAAQIIELLDKKPAYIGYHGQTLYHAPFDHISVQVGDAQILADSLEIPVVFNFRANDLLHHGQGAPLAPVYHRALVRAAGLESAAILNLGGTANVTITSSKSDRMIGFDTGPANGLLDKYVKEKTGSALDFDSHYASKGTVREKAVEALCKKAIILGSGKNYLDIKPPKSLDIRDYSYAVPEFTALPVEDGCATLNAFTAECVSRGLDWIQKEGLEIPEHWVLCGGGAKNIHLREQLCSRISKKAAKQIRLVSADQVGWSSQGMEAELFAFLAVRSQRGLPLTYPGTTGVKEPQCGGELFTPR